MWLHAGIVCTGETYKNASSRPSPARVRRWPTSRLFNASLDDKTRRAIDLHEGDTIDAPAPEALIRAAVALNLTAGRKG